MLLLDLILLTCAFYLSHLIRFDFDIPVWASARFKEWLIIVLAGKLVCFYYFDLYKGMWRYTGINDLLNIVKASTAGSLILIAVVLYTTRFEQMSRSVFIIDWCLTFMLIVGVRVVTRLCFENFSGNVGLRDVKHLLPRLFRSGRGQGRRMLIIGAGDCGEKICRQFHENPSVRSRVVGFLDDDQSKTGRNIHRVPVLGTIDELEIIAVSMEIEEVIIAIPSASSKRMREILDACRQADVNFKIIPDMGELIDGRITLNAIRNVEYRDLLGREPVRLDKEEIGQYLGKNVFW